MIVYALKNKIGQYFNEDLEIPVNHLFLSTLSSSIDYTKEVKKNNKLKNYEIWAVNINELGKIDKNFKSCGGEL